jgi:hypothetical protein
MAAFDIFTADHRTHAVIEDFGRHTAESGEGIGVAAQQRLHILMQHEAAPHHPTVAEYQREQPHDPLCLRLVGENGAEMREVHLRLAAGRCLKADFKAGGVAGTRLAQEVLHRRVSTTIAELMDLSKQTATGQFRKGYQPLAQVAFILRQLGWPRQTWPIHRRLDATREIFLDRTSMQPGSPGNRPTRSCVADVAPVS